MTTETIETETQSVETIFQTIRFREAQITEAEKAYEAALLDLANTAGKTFEHGGQWYQVCVRANKRKGRDVPFLKRLPGPPRSWLKGMPLGGWPVNQNTVETMPAPADETNTVETVEAQESGDSFETETTVVPEVGTQAAEADVLNAAQHVDAEVVLID